MNKEKEIEELEETIKELIKELTIDILIMEKECKKLAQKLNEINFKKDFIFKKLKPEEYEIIKAIHKYVNCIVGD